jgi:AcrR family transcriptional regulator
MSTNPAAKKENGADLDGGPVSKEREELSERVIGLAAAVLSKEGPDGLTVRRIAAESGASTQMIYTLFGGKFGLIDGLYREGFRRFDQFMHQREDPENPRRNLENWLRGYRIFAREQRPFFTVMFTRPVPEYTPPPESLQIAWASFHGLIRAIEKVQGQGDLPGDPIFFARKLWSQVHGIVTLEMIGHLWDNSGEKILDELLKSLWEKTSSH